MESMRIDVLGAVRAFHDDGTPVDLGGPRHREVLARLVAAGGRMVSTDSLVDDLWAEPPVRAVGALRTFVAALRRAIEPDRPPRTPPQVLVTEGPGYALRLPPHAVDVHRFEDALSRARRTPDGLTGLDAALAAWRGPAYADVTGSAWAQREQTRLEELRLEGVELRARLILDAGSGAELVADLGAHVTEHPWREPAWGLLARALHRAGRQADALATLRRARTMLADQLGLDPSADLRRLETDILHGTTTLQPSHALWTAGGLGPRTTVELARTLSLAGGDALVHARRDRLAALRAAERTGDNLLTASIINAYDVPALWSRADDLEQSRAVVAAAERTLTALGPDSPADLRARLLATVAVESRSADLSAVDRKRAGQAAREAEALARELGDPALLLFALNGVFLQSFTRPGLAAARDVTGAEILDLATRHELPNFAVLGGSSACNPPPLSATSMPRPHTPRPPSNSPTAPRRHSSPYLPPGPGPGSRPHTAPRRADRPLPRPRRTTAPPRTPSPHPRACRGCTAACSPWPSWACASCTAVRRPPTPLSTGARTGPGRAP